MNVSIFVMGIFVVEAMLSTNHLSNQMMLSTLMHSAQPSAAAPVTALLNQSKICSLPGPHKSDQRRVAERREEPTSVVCSAGLPHPSGQSLWLCCEGILGGVVNEGGAGTHALQLGQPVV